ncbi:histidine ammonia-lyase [Virgibacillus pantothenticus]|uniref:Histidine ammonia-lyase n=1 Tax=Virgibacillus pantothenticus TaxID=1473 RepID=A0A0L0QT29_VIRPA|nr:MULTISPECIES: histidine ammonia-lyase [Virgibacillus]API91187.1 histidine ammonia-lyase [Virgibacillus sp. 6R]KNE21860.1 histidine ammonia-lyase [Virgibacillus pantothenticus]MBS7429180.1 histidine ammonia-lyase [Virgibacillus sp. 19R1-5]MBU8567973.1 histidine ammonia-lyase [Virgibacillus pantothenticus]MBU8601770.1 histidine ammonia-lyase [Virgibacillus pantothenticus]
MIELTGHSLTIDEVRRVCLNLEKVTISNESMEKVKASREGVNQIVMNHETVYGINTGFGKFSDVIIDNGDVRDLQLNLIRSHACGVGEPFSETIARAMLLLRLNALIKGFSGVRPELVKLLAELINKQVHPVIPQQGSLGASGDLAPLAHLALVMIGEGKVFGEHGEIVDTKTVFSQKEITPITLQSKEGLALINGTQAMVAVGIISYIEAEKLAYDSEWIAAMTMEGLQGIIDAFHPAVHEARGYPQQIAVAKRMKMWLQGSGLITHQGQKRVQDAYSLRCIPQVHGASWQALDYVKEKLEIEINAATDNPLILQEGKQIISGGNFHGQPIALAMDFLKIAVAELANISERRIERLVNPQLNDLPAFLSPSPGLQSGAMIMQYVAASLVSENKTLAHPASVDSIPSSANQEDHVSMGTIGARHANMIIHNMRKVIAIECICALQAVEYRGIDKMAPKLREKWEKYRDIVPSITNDRIFAEDIDRMSIALQSN